MNGKRDMSLLKEDSISEQSVWSEWLQKLKAWKDEPEGKDDAFWLGIAVCFWLILWIDRFWSLMAAVLLGGLWISWRFHQGRYVLLWMVLGVFASIQLAGSDLQAQRVPEAGVYRVCEIRSGYAIASDGKNQVVVYEPESLILDQKISLSGFDRLHSLNNIGLFCFSSYAAQKGICYSAQQKTGDIRDDEEAESAEEDENKDGKKDVSPVPEDEENSVPQTLKAKVWCFVSSRKASCLYRLLLYGINDSESLEWIGSLGLPLMGLLSVLKKQGSRHLYKNQVSWILIALLAGMSLIVPVSVSMIRLAVFLVCGQFFENRQKRLGFSILGVLLLCPRSARSMSLVLPGAILFFSRFVQGGGRKRFVSTCVCALAQIVFMGKVNLFFLLAFSWMRQSFGWFFLVSLPGLVLEDWGVFLEKVLSQVDVSFETFELSGMAPFWYFWLLSSALVWICWKWSRGRALFCLLLFGLYPIIWHFDPFFHVYTMDVGQGDATVIVEPFGKSVVMIDAAGRFNHDNASELFIPFLKSRQIDAVDVLIVTHGDFDHDGAANALCEQFNVRRRIDSADENRKVPVDYAFEFLLEEREIDPDDENDKSLVTFFSYDGFRYLFTGDASAKIEEQILEQYDVKCDVLKLGHHGSDTSSCREFLLQADPQFAIISAGYQNRYGHPDRVVLERLDELGIDRLNTADHGMIHFMSFQHLLLVESADGLMARIDFSG